MGHVYRNQKEIEIPKGAYVSRKDSRVYVKVGDEGTKKSRLVIGRLTNTGNMIPNDSYKSLFPAEWKKISGESVPAVELNVGLFGVTLAICQNNSLYSLVQNTYGYDVGNAIIDYCMYSINDRCNTTQLFPIAMEKQFLFSMKPYSDAYYSKLFNTKMDEDKNHQLKINWLNSCVANGVKKVWLSVDGSNNDYNVSNSDIAEHGHAKSKNNSKLVSYIWAIDSEDGTPITHFENRGGMLDSKAFQYMIAFLGAAGVTIEGVILDRLFSSIEVIRTLKSLNLDYIIMLKSNANGHLEMLKEYAEAIRCKVKNIVDFKGVYGISDTKQLYLNSPEKEVINLFFDAANGVERSQSLLGKIEAEMESAQKSIAKGIAPVIDKKYANFIKITCENEGTSISINTEMLQTEIDLKGYYSIVSSKDFEPKTVHELYAKRDVSEKQFMISKSQMGFDTTNVHSDKAMMNRFTICFISAIIRSEIYNAAKELKLSTNQIIKEINRISLKYMPNSTYMFVDDLTERQKKIMKFFGIEASDFQAFANDYSNHIHNSVEIQTHMLAHDLRRPVPRKRGRPPKEKTEETEGKIKRPVGRPKGSKKKPATEESAVKRGRGRPLGSKNKPKTDVVKKKRGRPLGSKNKPKTVVEKSENKGLNSSESTSKIEADVVSESRVRGQK